MKSEMWGQQCHRDQGMRDDFVFNCSRKEEHEMHRPWESSTSGVPRYQPEATTVQLGQRQGREEETPTEAVTEASFWTQGLPTERVEATEMSGS